MTLTPPYQTFHRCKAGILPFGPAQTLVCRPPPDCCCWEEGIAAEEAFRREGAMLPL